MRTETINVYKFDELDSTAQDRAREWFRNGGEYHWIDEGIDSVKAFCKHYGVTLKDYSISPYAYSYFTTDAENQNFRGVTLKLVESEKDLMPTGYCVDADLFSTMFESMKANQGNTLQAFNESIDAGLKSIVSDMEYQDSNEHIDECLVINEYEFLESGARA